MKSMKDKGHTLFFTEQEAKLLMTALSITIGAHHDKNKYKGQYMMLYDSLKEYGLKQLGE